MVDKPSQTNKLTNDTTKATSTKSTNEPNTNGPSDTNGKSDLNSNTNFVATDSKGTPGFEALPERTAEQLGPDRPGFQPDSNQILSSDLAEGDSFTEKELNHPHASNFTPNTTMSSGPFTPDTFDKTRQIREDDRMPVKTFIRHPFEAAGNLAGVTPVLVENEPLNEAEVDRRIAQVLKDNGMDSASQLRAFAQIKVLLNAWEPQDSDKAITAKTMREDAKNTKQEVSEQLTTDKQREKDEQTKANLQKSMLSNRVANESTQLEANR